MPLIHSRAVVTLLGATLQAPPRLPRSWQASLILLLEPVLNPVWSWMAHGETPGGLAILGGTLVLVGTLGRAWWSERRAGAEKRATQEPENGSADLTETLSPH
jgi:drug/metabolite transporter (DMT)-like permease